MLGDSPGSQDLPKVLKVRGEVTGWENGQVTRGSDTPLHAWSPDEQATVDAIVAAR